MTSEDEMATGITSRAFFLADFAAVESGKAYVSGGFWDRIALPDFPSTGFFSVVAVIDVPWDAYDTTHSFEVIIVEAAGNQLAGGFDGQFQVTSAPFVKVGDPTIMPITAVINDLSFESPGDFAFILRVDGREIDRWRLHVIQADPEDAAPASIPFEPSGLPPASQS